MNTPTTALAGTTSTKKKTSPRGGLNPPYGRLNHPKMADNRQFIQEQFEQRLKNCTVEEYPKIAREYSIWIDKCAFQDLINNHSKPIKTRKEVIARVINEPTM